MMPFSLSLEYDNYPYVIKTAQSSAQIVFYCRQKHLQKCNVITRCNEFCCVIQSLMLAYS